MQDLRASSRKGGREGGYKDGRGDRRESREEKGGRKGEVRGKERNREEWKEGILPCLPSLCFLPSLPFLAPFHLALFFQFFFSCCQLKPILLY